MVDAYNFFRPHADGAVGGAGQDELVSVDKHDARDALTRIVSKYVTPGTLRAFI